MALSDKGMNKEPVATDFGQPIRLVTPTTAVPVSGAISSTPAVTSSSTVVNYACTGVSQNLLPADANRKGAIIENTSGSALYVKLGTGATTSSYSYKLPNSELIELGPTGCIWTGAVDVLSPGTTGSVLVTDMPGTAPAVSNAIFWVRAYAGVTETGNGTALTLWNDQTNNGWDVVPGNAPTWNAVVAGLNNQPSVNFTKASNHYLKNDSFNALNNAAAASGFAVIKPVDTAANQVFLSTVNANGFGIQVSTNLLIAYAGTGFATFGQVAYASATKAVIFVVYDGSQVGNANRLQVFVNGAQQTLSFTGTIPATLGAGSGMAVGTYYTTPTGTFNFNGDIPEAGLYARAVGTSERNTVEAYLKAEYATP